MTNRFHPIAALGGAAYLVLALVGFSLSVASLHGWADTADPVATVNHLVSYPPTPLTWLGLGLESVGLLGVILFGGYLSSRIQQHEAPPGWIGHAVLGLAVTATAVKVASFPATLTALLHPRRYDASVVAALLDVGSIASTVTVAVIATFVLVAASALLRYRICSRAVATGGVLAAALELTAVMAGAGEGIFQLPMMLWLGVAGIAVLRRPVTAPSMLVNGWIKTATPVPEQN